MVGYVTMRPRSPGWGSRAIAGKTRRVECQPGCGKVGAASCFGNCRRWVGYGGMVPAGVGVLAQTAGAGTGRAAAVTRALTVSWMACGRRGA